jgi:hypothetical protein
MIKMAKYERTSNGTQSRMNIKCYLYCAMLVNSVNYETYNKKYGHKNVHFVISDYIRSITKNRLKTHRDIQVVRHYFSEKWYW